MPTIERNKGKLVFIVQGQAAKELYEEAELNDEEHNYVLTEENKLYQIEYEIKGEEDCSYFCDITGAKTQIIKAGYTNFDSLKHDVTNEILDLQSLPRVGQKVVLEIRRWCLKPRKYLYERRIKDRRTTTSLG